MIELIVEDGSIVPNANTYVNTTTVRTYAEMRGITLPEDDEVLKTHIFDAMDYFEAIGRRFKGEKVKPYQALQFPRSDVYLDGYIQPQGVIPANVIKGVSQLACDAVTNGPLTSTGTTYAVKRTKVEGLEIEYATGSTAQSQPARVYAKAMGFIDPLIGIRPGNMLMR